jgi:hypothetical protein
MQKRMSMHTFDSPRRTLGPALHVQAKQNQAMPSLTRKTLQPGCTSNGLFLLNVMSSKAW